MDLSNQVTTAMEQMDSPQFSVDKFLRDFVLNNFTFSFKDGEEEFTTRLDNEAFQLITTPDTPAFYITQIMASVSASFTWGIATGF